MKANGLKYVTLTSLNRDLLERHWRDAWKVATQEEIQFRVDTSGSGQMSNIYHQDSYLIIATAQGNVQ